jgi:DNA repair exonuclease SbcCD ATPase subunit
MSVKNWFAASMLSAGVCLAALPALAQPQQQTSSGQQQTGDPVADAARKAREQQKTAPKPKKVYTDDDVKPATPSSAAGAATGQPAGGAQAAPGNGKDAAANGAGTGAAGKDDPETTWKKRFQEQHNKIATAEKELDILQRESEKAQVQYYNDPQKALMEQNTRKDINDKNAKIDQKKQEIANLKQQLSDMEDELRKSGGDPGWAR